MFSLHDNSILFNGQAVKTLPGELKLISNNDLAIVMYKISAQEIQKSGVDIVCKNVRAYNSTGKEIWQIEYRGDINRCAYFTGLAKQDDGFWAYRSDGWDVNFDPTSGKIIQNILGR